MDTLAAESSCWTWGTFPIQRKQEEGSFSHSLTPLPPPPSLFLSAPLFLSPSFQKLKTVKLVWNPKVASTPSANTVLSVADRPFSHSFASARRIGSTKESMSSKWLRLKSSQLWGTSLILKQGTQFSGQPRGTKSLWTTQWKTKEPWGAGGTNFTVNQSTVLFWRSKQPRAIGDAPTSRTHRLQKIWDASAEGYTGKHGSVARGASASPIVQPWISPLTNPHVLWHQLSILGMQPRTPLLSRHFNSPQSLLCKFSSDV